MRSKIFLVCVLILAFFTYPVYASNSKYLNEVNTKFTLNGKPIHPKLIEEFNPSLADSGKPIKISVDVLAAYNSNEYPYDEISIRKGNWIRLDNKEPNDNTYFAYKWLGKTNNDIHVLHIAESGGGSGVFISLFFVKFTTDVGINEKGNKYNRLLMSIVRIYTLGDRDDAEIKVTKDSVVIGKSIYRKKPQILRF
jgi:hypothetical protein